MCGIPDGYFPQHCLFFLPLPQGQGSFLLILGLAVTGLPFMGGLPVAMRLAISLGVWP